METKNLKWHEKYTGKPEDAHMGLLDDALFRIASVTTGNMPSGDVLSERNLETYEAYPPEQTDEEDFMPRSSRKKTADFDHISNIQDKRLARTLYNSSAEEDSAEVEGSLYFFYPGDLAILRVNAGSYGDVVRIKTFSSEDDLYQAWADIAEAAR